MTPSLAEIPTPPALARGHRRGRGLLLILSICAVALSLSACGGSSGSGEPVEISITITERGVDAPDRPRIELGSEVSMTFSAFEPGDAHLHGYDLWASVGPDGENQLDFTADQPGIFLLELEANLLYLTELVVQ